MTNPILERSVDNKTMNHGIQFIQMNDELKKKMNLIQEMIIKQFGRKISRPKLVLGLMDMAGFAFDAELTRVLPPDGFNIKEKV